MKLIYKPFGLLFGVIGGVAAGAAFKRLWRIAAHENDAPVATDLERSWREVVVAATLQGAVFGAIKALIDRAGATGFARLTGVWPGDTAVRRKTSR